MFRPHFLKLCFAHLRFTPVSFPTTRENLPSFLRKRGTAAHNFPTCDAPFVDGAFPRSTSPPFPDETHMRREDALARNAHNAHLSRFSFFAFTPSQAHHKQLIHKSLSVKTFISDTFTRLHLLFAPSSAHAATPHRAPRAIVPARDGGEGFASKTFTPIYMNHNILRHTGEGVKAKIEKRLMRAREKPSKK